MIEDLWYRRDYGARAARAALSPLSIAFGAAARLRGALYDRGLLRVAGAGVPVVSVGALSVGGAGKTPLVLWLVERLTDLGMRPCVLTRGYGGTARAPLLLDAGDELFSPALVAAAGDEAVLIAARSGAAVAVAADRAAGARLARQRLDPDVFVLDDGFQHRRLARDVDIVVVSGAEADLRLLPAGPLRELPSALARADVVVTTAQASLSDGSASDWLPPRAGVVAAASSGTPARLSMRLRPTCLVSSRTGAIAQPRAATDPERRAGDIGDLRALAGRKVAAVAAIARPERLAATLEEAGAVVVESLSFRDHHAYDAGDWERIAALARRCELVVTTEKDMVKLTALAGGAGWLAALRVEAELDGEDALLERIGGFDRKRAPTHHPPTFGGPAFQ
ncbi:MAG: tetraacyldisaccharide 4'-kinase [Deltaproteobacteria bacterium]|nr:tetraacyldisaccharide 4'-kinase [Deltaproteobacteria bacterium]